MKKHAGIGHGARAVASARLYPGRTAAGTFTKGNRVRVRHGLRSRTRALPPELEHLAVMEREDYQQSLADEGGAENVIRRRAQTLENRARVQRRIRQIDFALDRFGVFDGKGRLRQQWIDKLISLVGIATRIDIALGFARGARHVGALDDPAEYLAAQSEEATTCERG
jgi:hypothetical protein